MDPQVAAMTTSKRVFLWFWKADKWSSDDHIFDIFHQMVVIKERENMLKCDPIN